MEIINLLKRAFLEGFATSDLSLAAILICIFSTVLISAYIFLLYRRINKNAFYNRSFNLALIGIALVTASVILTIQSNIVVSLGMVGALSIVRFRTAIKDPMDLMFLFWSISVGIICGAGFAIIAVIASLAMTAVILCFNLIPDAKGNLVLVVNADNCSLEPEIMGLIDSDCSYAKVRARNASHSGLNLAVEVRVEDQSGLIQKLIAQPGVTFASLVEHEGDIVA